ncbi:MAG: DUF1552 domain-containing protein [Myxococcales bacterium]|nr:DUF1552 domain-containing protein [Myxococcales bacterium]
MARVLGRRTFLRGIGGVAVALPTLEIMLDRHGTALAGGGALPHRFLVSFDGGALGADNDPMHNAYAPDTVGPGYDLKTAIMPLGDYGNVRDEVSVVSGLRIPYGTGPIPAGGWAQDFHIQALGPLISGMRNNATDDYGVNGPTADQIVADAIGGETTFRSLAYQVQASWYLTQSAPYGRDVISYRSEGGNIVANPGQTSPRLAYQALFTGFVPPDPGQAADLLYELEKRRSVLDRVGASIDTLMPQLGAADRQRMQRHLDEIRDLEMRLSAAPPDAGAGCQMLPDPGADPPVGGDNASAGGSDYDVNAGWSNESARARIFADLIHMAFTCDLTRSVAWLMTMAQSHMNIHPITGIPYDQHELGHGGGTTEDMGRVRAWHIDHFAYLVARLRDTPEAAGAVLDRCAMVHLNEAGHGYDPGSGNMLSTHSTENMCCLIAGRAGGLAPGQHVVADGMHPGNVLNSAMQAVGVDQDLGEVTGRIDALFG